MNKIRVAIVFGGKSAEHEVSINSAKNIISAIDKNKYEVIEVKIEKNGDISHFIKTLLEEKINVVFPVLHGPFGEDGTIQGMLKLMNVPFVGPSVLGSAIGMDKETAKRLLKEAGIPIARFVTITKKTNKTFSELKKELGLPFFVKPANLGSSVGIHKIKTENEFDSAVADAFKYDIKIIAEEFIRGREIECSVLGNEEPIASIPGEIIVSKNHDFYSYDAKYLDEKGADLIIPAKLTDKEKKDIQDLAIKTFIALECEGMSRVDFFLEESGRVFVNEINTIPGFTKISMYPKLFEASGISYADLIDNLITLAFERFNREQGLQTSFER